VVVEAGDLEDLEHTLLAAVLDNPAENLPVDIDMAQAVDMVPVGFGANRLVVVVVRSHGEQLVAAGSTGGSTWRL